MTTTTSFRISPADPEVLRDLEAAGSEELRQHFELIRGGLEALPGVPGEAIYGAVTLRTIALQRDVFTHLFLTEHHAAKQGSVDQAARWRVVRPGVGTTSSTTHTSARSHPARRMRRRMSEMS